MVVISYENKMAYLEYLRQRQRKSFKVDLIECIMEDVRDMHIINEEAVKFNKIEKKKASDIYEEMFLK